MADRGSASTLIGVGGIGLGALVLYGAYRNVPVFGANGLLTGALKTGKLQAISAKNAQSQAAKQAAPSPWWQALNPLNLIPGGGPKLTKAQTGTGTIAV